MLSSKRLSSEVSLQPKEENHVSAGPHQASSSSLLSQAPCAQPARSRLVPPCPSNSSQPPAQRRRSHRGYLPQYCSVHWFALLIGAVWAFLSPGDFFLRMKRLPSVSSHGAGGLLRSRSTPYRFVERLRIASYFYSNGSAFIPLTGVAIYVLKIWTGRTLASGSSRSLAGTAATRACAPHA